MARATEIGKGMWPRRKQGFTLVELLLVLFVVALLASLVTPVVTNSIYRAREATLKEDLNVMRKAIDDYYADNGRHPETLAKLVEKRYLRAIPIDPITERKDSWLEIKEENKGKEQGVVDVKSGAEGKSADGVPYREW